MKLYWHISITQSTEFTLNFTPSVALSISFNKFMVCIHHYRITQSSCTPLKISVIFITDPNSTPLPAPGNIWSFHCLHSFAFSQIWLGSCVALEHLWGYPKPKDKEEWATWQAEEWQLHGLADWKPQSQKINQ